MKATILGMKVDALFFLGAVVALVAAQLTVFRFGRRTPLLHGAERTFSWTRGRMLTCVAMVILSVLAFIVVVFAFVTSFIEQWQILWLIAAALALAGSAGLVAAGRLSSG